MSILLYGFLLMDFYCILLSSAKTARCQLEWGRNAPCKRDSLVAVYKRTCSPRFCKFVVLSFSLPWTNTLPLLGSREQCKMKVLAYPGLLQYQLSSHPACCQAGTAIKLKFASHRAFCWGHKQEVNLRRWEAGPYICCCADELTRFTLYALWLGL